MNRLLPAIFILILTVPALCADGPDPNPPLTPPESSCQTHDPNQPDPNQLNAVDQLINRLHDRAKDLKSYECQIEYKFTQPWLDSQALRKGVLYYLKGDEKSRLRINFSTLQQDDQKEQKYSEQYIFDGVWLTQINYQIKTVKKYQLAEPNNPADAFEIASRNLPIIGFTKPKDLKEQFEIEIVPQKNAVQPNFTQLHLKVKPNSIYKDDYTTIDFRVDNQLNLPTKVVAVSTENEDIYELKFTQPKLNKKIDDKTFDFKIPSGFGEPEIVPLKKNQ